MSEMMLLPCCEAEVAPWVLRAMAWCREAVQEWPVFWDSDGGHVWWKYCWRILETLNSMGDLLPGTLVLLFTSCFSEVPQHLNDTDFDGEKAAGLLQQFLIPTRCKFDGESCDLWQ
ncbi:hypothetical protein Nmel_005691 [Mimus melanotis]